MAGKPLNYTSKSMVSFRDQFNEDRRTAKNVSIFCPACLKQFSGDTADAQYKVHYKKAHGKK